MARYDSAITIFSPDGHLYVLPHLVSHPLVPPLISTLLQVPGGICPGSSGPRNSGSGSPGVGLHRVGCAVCIDQCDLVMRIRSRLGEYSSSCCIGAEKKSAAKLQESRTVRKIVHVDDNICLAFSGLTADARVLIDKARVEAQSFRLTFDEPVAVEYITKYIAQVQQLYTQKRGERPFGISTLVVGFDSHGKPQLYQTDPSGIYSAWKANAIGRNSKTVRLSTAMQPLLCIHRGYPMAAACSLSK